MNINKIFLHPRVIYMKHVKNDNSINFQSAVNFIFYKYSLTEGLPTAQIIFIVLACWGLEVDTTLIDYMVHRKLST